MVFKDIFFPKICLSCGFLGSYLCLSCQRKLIKVSHDTCFYCRRRSFTGLTHPGCKRRLGVEGFLSVFHYNDVLKRSIKNIKYRLVKEALFELLTLIPPSFISKLAFFKNDKLYLQPIPLHNRREKERGFNQAELIAQFLSQYLPFPLIDGLIRTKDTASQSKLDARKERLANIRGAFVSRESAKVGGRQIILIDDVVTSGATVSQAAKVLKRSGATEVYVFTLAKG
ncbi:ComF family protein [Candidatus Roizmanbacteria bacterium]|nr:ComF family protein [Candidatus Roizmanbacteria bacterium]